jgi:dienelactone hydrolase
MRFRSVRLVAVIAALAALVLASLAAGTAGASPSGRPAATHQPGRATGAVSVTDVTIAVPHQPPVRAFVVAPPEGGRRHSHAGVLWLHWLGQIHNDRSEFLSQAVDLAQEAGVVSILPEGTFPWYEGPDGSARDRTQVEDQLAAYRRVLDRLAGDERVDPQRIAVVGHDYGAMYGALLADRDPRVSALALQAPDARWGDWFASYWLELEGEQRDAYAELFDGLDPVEHVARLRSHVLLQFAGLDDYVTAEVADAFSAANPHAQRIDYPRADHQLTDKGILDLQQFLAAQLRLG